MDRTYIDDHHIVARYLADQLPDDEREAFEAYYLEHPDVVREMEAAARFKIGLQRLRDSGELDELLSTRPWYRQPRYLAAAAVAVMAIGIVLFLGRTASRQPLLVASSALLHDSSGNPWPIASRHMIVRTRTMSYDAEIDIPEAAQTIELRVLPEYEAQPPRYRVRLSSIVDNAQLQQVAEIAGLAPADDGFVSVFLNGAQLEPGRYQLALSGDEGTSTKNEESSFLIRMRAAADRIH